MTADDDHLVQVFDLVDDIVQLKEALSDALSRGYMSIATERYNNRTSSLGRVRCFKLSEVVVLVVTVVLLFLLQPIFPRSSLMCVETTPSS